MTARAALAGLAALAAAFATATAPAATSGTDPKTLVLQKAGFPAGARQTMKHADRDAHQASYFVSYRFKGGSQMLELTSFAIVMSPKLAGAAFRQQRALLEGRRVRLPRYGDEQVAVLAREDNEGELWVRKGGTMWGMSVNTAGAGNWGLITRAESLAQLRRYAPKQMKRVGGG